MPGVGIGLYLARMIMELQRGYIEVKSEPGKGACFSLYFPVKEPEQNLRKVSQPCDN